MKRIIFVPKKIDLIEKTFNQENKQRIIFHELPGKGHAILTLDFIEEEGHPTLRTLNDIFEYYNEQLNE